MRKMSLMKKFSKGLLSVLLALTLLLSLGVPLTVFAAGDGAATGSNIYAYFKKIDPDRNQYRNLELVFASSEPAAGSYVGSVFKDFADREFVTTTYKYDSSGRPLAEWNYHQWSVSSTPASALAPWTKDPLACYNNSYGTNIRKITFKDRIAPKSIAGWFYGLSYVYEINGLEENLDTSLCENMSFAFWMMNTSAEIWTNINDNGVNIKGRYLQSLDLSNFDISHVKKIDNFLYSKCLENLDVSGFDFSGLNDNIVTVSNPDNRTCGYSNENGSWVYAPYPEKTVPVKSLKYFMDQCLALENINLDRVNLSCVENITNFVSRTGVTKLDLSKVEGPKNAYSCESLFYGNTNLKEVIFGTEDHPFKVGITPQYLGLPRGGYDNPFTAADETDGIATANLKGYMNPFRSTAIWFGSTFSGCTSLATIDLQYLKINGFSDSYTYNTTDAGRRAGLELGVRYQMNSFFANCTSLEHIENLDKLGFSQQYTGNWVARQMFINCESLQEIDLSNYYANISGPGIFLGDSSLKKLDLSGMGRGFVVNNSSNNSIYDNMWKGFQSYDNENATSSNPTGKTKSNVFEGCTELSEVVLSPYYYGEAPQKNSTTHPLTANVSGKTDKTAYQVLTYTSNAASSYTKIEQDIPPVGDDVLWTKIKHPDDITVYNSQEYPSNQTWNVRGFHFASNDELVKVGTMKKTSELFGDFKPEYAGTWVRTDKITLDANGGEPRTQTFVGAAGVTLDPSKYDEAKIKDPTRVGYVFQGWYATDDEGNEYKLEDQLALNRDDDPSNDVVVTAWRYYAKWKENHYTLKLNGNGGTTAAVAGENEGEYVTSDGKVVTETSGSGENVKAIEYIASGSLGYAEFYELSSTLFSRNGYLLTGWNTRANGEGTEYSANDSVNMLSSADGGEATLYAQWYKPDFILKFDAQGGSAVADRNYDLPSQYGYLAESARDGYTFRGWYTAAEGGKKVVTKSGTLADDEIRDVDPAYGTLYAQWDQNPTVIFDANGYDSNNHPVAYFNDNEDLHTLPKVYNYGQNLGVIPTPEYGSAVIKEWNTAADGTGDTVDKDTIVGADGTVYYAQWGYRPKFETNGGVYDVFPNYEIKDDPSYTITTLPTIHKENATFEGWFVEGTSQALANGAEVDLSSGKAIEARWAETTPVEITLVPEGGTLDSLYYDSQNNKYRIKVYKNTEIGELPTPKKPGCDFLGWNTAADGSGTDYTAATTIGDNPVTLHAVWAERVNTVTFDAGEGALYDNSEATKKVRNNGHITDQPGALRSNYILEGWYSNLTDPQTKLTPETEITGNVTYYANWVLKENTPSVDGVYAYDIYWSTPCNDYADNFGDKLVIAPQTGNNSLSATLSVAFQFTEVLESPGAETTKILPAFSVKVLMPKKVFYGYDNNGNYKALGTDNITAGLGNKTDRDDTEFWFVADDPTYPDYYVITNNNPISKARTYTFDISYTVSSSELRSIKGGYTDENGYFCGTYFDENYNVSVKVDQNGDGTYSTSDGDTDITESVNLEVHTDVKTTNTVKTQWKASFDWDYEWGADRPDDYDQYFYIVWKVTSSHDKSGSQKFKISWSENTVHDGSYVTDYPENHKDPYKDWLQSGTYSWIIVTKHTRNPEDEGWKTISNEAILDVEYLSGYHEQFRALCPDAGVYLLPDAPFRFDKFLSGKLVGTSDSFKHGGQDNILAHRPVNNLTFEVAYQEYKNQDNPTWNDKTKTYTTPERTIVISDGDKGDNDVRLSTVKGNDRYNWGSSSEMVLNDSDYEFTELTVFMSEFDAAKIKTTVNNEEAMVWSDPFVHQSYGDYTDIEIWTRTEGDSEFKPYRTLKASEFILTEDDPATEKVDEREVYGIINTTVTLPANTVGYQLKHKSEFFSSQISAYANMRLKATNHVLTRVREDVAGGYDSLVKNNCTLQVNNKKPEESMDTKTGGASLCAYQLGIGKSYICADNRLASVSPPIEGNYEEFPALMCGWGYTASEDAIKLIESGEFNDLLPYNFTVDKSSIYVKPIFGNIDGKTEQIVKDANNADKKIKSITEYVTVAQYNTKKEETSFYLNGETYDATPFKQAYWSVKFTDNWEDSGRTMMTISVNTPAGIDATGYYVFYKMKTTLSNISANGPTQTNYVSFTDTTENQSVPLAKEGNISGIDKKFQPYYTSIDNKYTAFASASTNMIPPSTTATGINSSVLTDGELETKNITVGLDADYTYTVTHSNNLAAKDIIIYDILVNSLNGQTYEWNGSFNGIDISSLTTSEMASDTTSKALMAPVVYYCIKSSDLDAGDLDITKTDIWTTTMPSDKSTIKAIAVDCRKDVNGEDYILPQNKPISFNLMMHSPDSSDHNDVYTYNEAHVYGSINGNAYTNKSLTSVLLHYATPQFSKSSFPKSGDGPDPDDPESVDRKGVVNKSVINYNLEVYNPDADVSIKNVVVEDLLDANLTINNMPKVQIGEDEPVPFNKAPIISSYEITEENGRTKFTATISSVGPDETITIILPATVNAALDSPIDNTAEIVGANGLETEIYSDTTYHYVTVPQARIMKVDSADEGLAGAVLEIYEDSDENFNSDGSLKEGATPVTITFNGSTGTQFNSTNDVMTFPLDPGDYVLHEVSAPTVSGTTYKRAADIPFTIDIEGITHVDGASVDFVKMIDEPDYKIVFHENKPGGTIEEANKEFKVVEPKSLAEGKIEPFYEIPDWAGDEYVFAGWYHSSTWKSYASVGNIKNNVTVAANFTNDTFSKKNGASDSNGIYHLYAIWIPVGTVEQAKRDEVNQDAPVDANNYGDTPIRGFGLAGVQYRASGMADLNHGDEYKKQPGGLRFVTSLSEELYDAVYNLSNDIEYGYVVGTEANINQFTQHYNVKDLTKYKLQYKDNNVNGVDTSGDIEANRSAETDFRYVTNVNCTSEYKANSRSVVALDHENFAAYRLYTLVVTYEGEDDTIANRNAKIDARAYIRYTDANGMVRVFYNDYKKNMYYGGCLCSYNQVQSMAIPVDEAEESTD